MHSEGELRYKLSAFGAGEINPKTGYPFPLRHFEGLHEHIYRSVSPLCKVPNPSP